MTTAIDLLITPFRFGFMADALIISLLVAVPYTMLLHRATRESLGLRLKGTPSCPLSKAASSR